jgi:hypothetical protein
MFWFVGGGIPENSAVIEIDIEEVCSLPSRSYLYLVDVEWRRMELLGEWRASYGQFW